MHKAASQNAKNQALFWGSVSLAAAGFLWLFSGVLTPFVTGLAVAYLLDPVIDRLEKRKMPRWAGAILILLLFYGLTASILILALPPFYREAQALAAAAPEMIDKLWTALSPHILWLQQRLGIDGVESAKTLLANNATKALGIGGGVLAGIGHGGRAVTGFLSFLAITPLVAFFMMKEWPRMTAWFDGLLPRSSRDTIRGLLSQIDRKLAGFVRGQISVACALALLYSVGLALTGVKFGFLIGLCAGMLYVVPYLGTAFGLAAGLAAALFQGFTVALALKIAAVFALGQAVETYFLTPRLVGGSVGLHPVCILFAVMAGGSLFGVTGMLLAVPTAAVASVLLGHAVVRYKDSAYFTGGRQ